MKSILLLLLVIILSVNCQDNKLPRYDTLTINSPNSTCIDTYTLGDACKLTCGPGGMQFNKSETDSDQITYIWRENTCDNTNYVSIGFQCNTNLTWSRVINGEKFVFIPKCSCFNKSKCTGIPNTPAPTPTHSESSNNQSDSSNGFIISFNNQLILLLNFLLFLILI